MGLNIFSSMFDTPYLLGTPDDLYEISPDFMAQMPTQNRLSSVQQLPPQFSPSIEIDSTPDRENMLQRLADTLAGDQYSGITGQDRDRALGQALMDMGSRLTAAATAGSWTKAAPYLNQMLSSGYGTFNKALQESEKHRWSLADREDQIKARELAMTEAERRGKISQMELEDKERDTSSREMLRAEAEKNAASWKAAFDSVINDPDITEQERKIFTQNFNFALQNYTARPDNPDAINTILDYVGKVGTAAGQTEKIDQQVGLTLYEEARRVGLPVEKYIEDQRKLHGLKITEAQAAVALTQERAQTEDAQQRYYDTGGSKGSTGEVTDSRLFTMINSTVDTLAKNDELRGLLGEVAAGTMSPLDFKKTPQYYQVSWLFDNGEVSKQSAQETLNLIMNPMARGQLFAKVEGAWSQSQGGFPAAPQAALPQVENDTIVKAATRFMADAKSKGQNITMAEAIEYMKKNPAKAAMLGGM